MLRVPVLCQEEQGARGRERCCRALMGATQGKQPREGHKIRGQTGRAAQDTEELGELTVTAFCCPAGSTRDHGSGWT